MIKTLNKFSLFLLINKIEGEKKSGKYNFGTLILLLAHDPLLLMVIIIKLRFEPLKEWYNCLQIQLFD